MTYLPNENASPKEGDHVNQAGGPRATKQKKARYSDHHSINNVLAEIQAAGLRLKSTSGETQLATLPKVLQHFGPRGISTYEGVAAGYLRIATRVKELKDVWIINTLREDVIGPDGMFHKRCARYVLIGKRADLAQPQQDLLAKESA